MNPARPRVTVVIPTYNERENLRELIPALLEATPGLELDLVVVDDGSPDGTADEVRRLAHEYPVVVIDRGAKGGLAGAVREGFRNATGQIVGVMDADWSHDPTSVPAIVRPIADGAADLTVGSRLVDGGRVENWPWHRRWISRLATLPARTISGVHDPMSGFFFFDRGLLPIARGTTAVGYKILLDLLVSARGCRVVEVPIVFRDRRHGTTKLDAREAWRYVGDLSRAAWKRWTGPSMRR